MLQEGVLAPEFELMDQDENPHKLSDYRGKKVVLYFYPKDDTPGCTKEACSFRDSFAEFRQKGLVVLGVSKDSPKSHAKFQEKYSLPFPLLSDTSTEMIKAYEAWGEKKFMGKTYTGTLRVTYIIDEDGKIQKAYEDVKPQDHAQEILKDILQKIFSRGAGFQPGSYFIEGSGQLWRLPKGCQACNILSIRSIKDGQPRSHNPE